MSPFPSRKLCFMNFCGAKGDKKRPIVAYVSNRSAFGETSQVDGAPASAALAFRFAAVIAILGCGLASTSTAAERGVDFDTEVVPVLTRYGCNAGACHGAATGRGGFGLSLFGSDAASDWASIASALEGRRVHQADPHRSLILRKATESISHGGGERFHDGSEAYDRLARWIAQGAKRTGHRKLAELVVSPETITLEPTGWPPTVRLNVIAKFDDGETDDVTRWAVITAEDPSAIEVAPSSGALTVHRRGEHLAIVRFLDQVRPVRVTLPLRDEVPPGLDSPTPDRSGDRSTVSLIDRHVDAKLRQLRLPASGRADDHAFLRRVWLDLAGRLPEPEEIDRFVGDRSADKRARLVERLLDSEEFAEYWALKWANFLRIDSGPLQPEGAKAFHHWVQKRFRDDLGWDEAAWEMLTATGDGFARGPVNFLRVPGGPDAVAEAASRVFMGVRLQCANCHNHPLDRWTQDDYHGLAAVFAKLRRGRTVTVGDRGEVTHPVTGEPARPRIPGERFLDESDSGERDPRREFARWVTAPENPFLARATVNRVWSELMGRGLIEPVDDIRATNPASHPELLDALADAFVDDGFRFRPLIRRICLSEAYQRSGLATVENRSDTRYYSHAPAKPLEAEVIADAIAWATGTTIRDRAAVRETDNRVASIPLDVLGRCDRGEGCESAASTDASLARVLHFLNGGLLNDPIAAPDGVLGRALSSEEAPMTIGDRLYLRTLSRPMNRAERSHWEERLASADPSEVRERLEDLFWGLLTSDAFLTNR